MLVSVVILIIVTFVLAFGLYLAEVRVRPKYSFWDAMVWNFVKYVGDPAEYASAPITLQGKRQGKGMVLLMQFYHLCYSVLHHHFATS